MSGPITVTLSYQVRRGRASQFSVSATALLGMAARQLGYLGAGVIGTVSTGRDWQIFYRFEDETSLGEWERSSPYIRWIDYVEKFATRAEGWRVVGDETRSDDRERARPHQHTMAAPAGRARERQEGAHREPTPVAAAHAEQPRVDETQVMPPALRAAARMEVARAEAPRVDETQVMPPALRAAARREAAHAQVAHADEPGVDETQVMAARVAAALSWDPGQPPSGRHDRPRVDGPPIDRSGADRSGIDRSGADRSGARRSRADRPRFAEPQFEQPWLDQPGDEPSRPERRRESAQWEPDQWESEFRELVAREPGWGPAPGPQDPVPLSQPLPRIQPAQWQAAQREAVAREAAEREAAEREAAEREMAQREAAQWEVEQREAQQREAAQREAAQREVTLLEAARRAVGNREPVRQPESGRSAGGQVDREQGRRRGRRRQPNREQATDWEQQPSADLTLSQAQQRELFGDIEIPRSDGDPLAVARGRRK